MIGSLSSGLRGHQKARKPRGWNPPPPGAVGIVESPVLIELINSGRGHHKLPFDTPRIEIW